MSEEDYLRNVYFDPSHPASFSGPDKLHRIVKHEGMFKVEKKKLKQWLQDQDEYSMFRDVKFFLPHQNSCIGSRFSIGNRPRQC